MSDQQHDFNTETFSPSPFDTFQVPISDIVTQSVEDTLAATSAPIVPEADVQPEVAETPVEIEPQTESAATPAVISEVQADSAEPETTIDVEMAKESVEVEAEEHLDVAAAASKPEPVIEQEVIEEETAAPEVEELEVVDSVEVATEEESVSQLIDDVMIPPPVAAVPKTVKVIHIPKATLAAEAAPPAAQPAPEPEPEQTATPERAIAPQPVTEVPAKPSPLEAIRQSANPTTPAPTTPAVPEPEPEPAPEPSVSTPTPVEPPVEVVAEETVESGFRALELREEVQQAIEASGYTTPTDIQAQIIPHVLAGRDILAQSQTGTGKTAAFALPILSKINVAANKPQVLVLAPTRELAMQVADSFTTYGKQIPRLDVAAVYGGQGYDTQLRQLRRGVPIVVGTPGRVIDHIKRRTLDLSELECLVLDEADEMLNMGFLEDVKFVLEQTPAQRQVALFSATLPGPIQKIAQQYLNDPVRITIKRKTMTADAIRQRAVFVAHRDKLDVLSRFLDVEETDGVIIFTKTREATVTVAEHLVREGFKAVALNGDMPQNVRERTIAQLKSSRLDIVVATDVAARGLDVSRISHVFNFDVPQDTESYVHRIGRTGRAGRKGEAIILLSNSQRFKLKQIERLTKQPIQVVSAPTADDINAARVVRFKQKITEVAEGKDLTQFTQMLKDYAEETGKPFEEIAAALAEITQNGRPFFVQDRPNRNRNRREEGFRDDRSNGRDRNDRFNDRRERDERPSRQPRRAGRVEAGMDRYRIEVGHDDGVKPGNIVGAVANEGGIEGEFIGPINIFGNYSTIDLPEGMPREVYEVLQQVRVAGKQLRIRRATEGDSHGETGGGGGGGGRSFKPRGQKRFGGKPRSGGHGGNFDNRKKRRPRN